jgi:hypothetical protein
MQLWQNQLLVWASNQGWVLRAILDFFFLDYPVFLQTLRIYAHGLLSLITINCDVYVFLTKKNIKNIFCVLHMANTLTCFERFFKENKYWKFRKCVFAWIS